ncbi:MAG: AAA family ATPase [Myxococcales bacterium]|nr:AAA family ATPase [Myxococcales bacterium]MCB9541526.1 AAA family ATPase [Myxococcales bacterium]
MTGHDVQDLDLDPRPAPPRAPDAPGAIGSLDDARRVIDRIRDRVRYDVMGRDDVIELVLIAFLGDGHVLLEDYPGSGKTTLAKALGESIADTARDAEIAAFRRVQFTPDMLPGDITGVMVFDTQTSDFYFRRGPAFAHVLLVDEINRTSPKVQAALLEAMAEKQVTVDNISHRLDALFFVIATQNPLDSVGTYPLPVAQLDRFLFKVRMEHVDRASELEVLASWGKPRGRPEALPRVTRDEVLAARARVRDEVAVSPRVHECLVDIAAILRADKRVTQGVSTRSLVQAIPALQVRAMMKGRDFVAPEDIDHLAIPIFRHRLALMPGADAPERVVRDALTRPLETLSRSTLRR